MILLTAVFMQSKPVMMIKALLFIHCFVFHVLAFVPVPLTSQFKVVQPLPWGEQLLQSLSRPSLKLDENKLHSASVLGFVNGAVLIVQGAWAAGEGVEMADLPPPYVPVLFGVGVIAGVGLLTGSLGNVIDEEASLGMQSGARARKDIERSRSSYFKKK
jgi:hypothetical protein